MRTLLEVTEVETEESRRAILRLTMGNEYLHTGLGMNLLAYYRQVRIVQGGADGISTTPISYGGMYP